MREPTHAQMVEDHILGEVQDQQKQEAIEERAKEIMLDNDSIPYEGARMLAREELGEKPEGVEIDQ